MTPLTPTLEERRPAAVADTTAGQGSNAQAAEAP